MELEDRNNYYDKVQKDEVLIPAHPGFTLIRAFADGDYIEYPIIAWLINPLAPELLEPVIVSAVEAGRGHEAIRLPSGRVVSTCNTEWATVEEAVKELSEEARRSVEFDAEIEIEKANKEAAPS